jgi:hypothetical protein
MCRERSGPAIRWRARERRGGWLWRCRERPGPTVRSKGRGRRGSWLTAGGSPLHPAAGQNRGHSCRRTMLVAGPGEGTGPTAWAVASLELKETNDDQHHYYVARSSDAVHPLPNPTLTLVLGRPRAIADGLAPGRAPQIGPTAPIGPCCEPLASPTKRQSGPRAEEPTANPWRRRRQPQSPTHSATMLGG